MSDVDEATISSWPRAAATLRADGTGEVVVNGVTQVIEADDLAAGRAKAQELLVHAAAQLGRPLRFSVTEPDGHTWQLLAHPDGRIAVAGATSAENSPSAPSSSPAAGQPATAPAVSPAAGVTTPPARGLRRPAVALAVGLAALLVAVATAGVSLGAVKASHDTAAAATREAADNAARMSRQVTDAQAQVKAAQTAQKTAEDKAAAAEQQAEKAQAAEKVARDRAADLTQQLTKAQAAAKKTSKSHTEKK